MVALVAAASRFAGIVAEIRVPEVTVEARVSGLPFAVKGSIQVTVMPVRKLLPIRPRVKPAAVAVLELWLSELRTGAGFTAICAVFPWPKPRESECRTKTLCSPGVVTAAALNVMVMSVGVTEVGVKVRPPAAPKSQ